MASMDVDGDDGGSPGSPEVNFEAVLEDCRVLLKTLQSICFGERATVLINSLGIIITMEHSKCCQLSIFLIWELFRSHTPVEEEFSFAINAKELINFLAIFANDSDNDGPNAFLNDTTTNLKLRYGGLGHPFHLLIEKPEHTTECKLFTFEPQDSLSVEFTDDEATNRAILETSEYKEIWSDLDSASKEFGIEFTTNPQRLKFITKSNYANTTIELGATCKGVIELDCKEDQRNFYQMTFIRLSQKILGQAHKVKLLTNQDGLLGMKFVILMEEEKQAFANFYCVSNRSVD